jgi:hypothetical protein
MNTKQFALGLGATVSVLAMSAVLAAASPTAHQYKAPLNSYGQPDLEGTRTNSTLS